MKKSGAVIGTRPCATAWPLTLRVTSSGAAALGANGLAVVCGRLTCYVFSINQAWAFAASSLKVFDETMPEAFAGKEKRQVQ